MSVLAKRVAQRDWRDHINLAGIERVPAIFLIAEVTASDNHCAWPRR